MTHRARSAAAVLAVAVLAACSGDDGSTASTASTPATTVDSTTSTLPSTTAASAPSTSTASSTSSSTSTTSPLPAPPATVEDLLALGRPIVLAHTGGEDEFPASTMFAFGESMKAGVDMLDLNVQLTRDGVLVVHHDDSVDRTTDGTGNVADMDLPAIQALDDAYWFTADCVCKDRTDADYLYRGMRTGAKPPPAGYSAEDFAVPTLRQLIGRYPDVPLNIEVKGDGQHGIDTATALVTELTALGRLDATVLSSFDDGVVEALQRLAPTAEISPGVGASAGWVLNNTPLPPRQRILQLPPRFEGTEVLTPEVIARSHAAGYLIWVWPDDRDLEDAESYADLLAMGMDGLNINFPATGVAAVEAFVASG